MKSRPVSVLKTSPKTYMEDYSKLMKLARFDKLMDPNVETILKINISWQEYLPACSKLFCKRRWNPGVTLYKLKIIKSI